MNLTANKLLLVGAGGHCWSVLDSIDRTQYADIAIIDLPEKTGQYVSDVPVVGTDQDIPLLYAKGYQMAIITIGNIGIPKKRMEMYQLLKAAGFSFPSVIDKTAIVSYSGTVIEEGVFIGKGVIVNTRVGLGVCSIVNSGAIIDHDCEIGRFAHVGPGVCLSGGVLVGDNTLIGIGSSIMQSIVVGRDTIVGAGSVVVRDMPDGVVACGNPCRVLRKTEG